MTFLVPWAFAIAGMAAAGTVLLHFVSQQRPAAYVFPTTRFIPDRRALVSRASARPRDLLLLVVRVLLLLSAGAAFARPVMAPHRGAIARVVLLDRSRAVANAPNAVAAARAALSDGAPSILIAFDSIPTIVATTALDSLVGAPRSNAVGSLSAALVAGRRASATLAQRADSVQLVLVSPVAVSEIDSATRLLRAEWLGAMRIERVAVRADTAAGWRLERSIAADDLLGPATAPLRSASGDILTRLVRHAPTVQDSTFARSGGTVVRWDSAAVVHASAEGLAVGDDVIVAALARRLVSPTGRVVARWADGSVAASESSLGTGCVRDVGIVVPVAGDIALHPPFQHIARALLAPCGVFATERAADSSTVAWLVGKSHNAARAGALRGEDSRPSPLARWLLALAIAFALAELFVRATTAQVAE